MIKAKADAHMALSATLGDLSKRSVEILIGAEGNRKSFIKDGLAGAVRSEALTMNILSEQVRLSHVTHIYAVWSVPLFFLPTHFQDSSKTL